MARELDACIAIKGKVDPSLQRSAKEASSKLGSLKKFGESAAKGLAKIGTVTAIVGAGIAAGAAVGSKALLDLGSQFDEAKDTIRIGTGAVGDSLDSLYKDMESVYKAVPTTMEDASSAIADYNTRLGLTGEPLQKLSEQAIQVSDMLGEDLSTTIEDSSKAFQQWKISAGDMGGAMDYVFKVSQSTGTGFNDLMADMQSYGAQLQEMGFGFNEATALMGQLDKAGVNTSEVLGAMKKSVSVLAGEGISASDGLKQYYDSIMSAKDATEATSIASEVFGKRAGSTMTAAIRDGTLSAEQLTATLESSGETINGAATDTYDFAEQFQLLKQNAQVALEPIASNVFGLVNKAFPYIQSAMDNLLPVIIDIASKTVPFVSGLVEKAFPKIGELIGNILPAISDIAQNVLPIVSNVLGNIFSILGGKGGVLETIIKSITHLLPMVKELISSLLPPIINLIKTILPLIGQIMTSLQPLIKSILGIVSVVIPPLINIMTTLMPFIAQLITIIAQTLTPVINGIMVGIQPVMAALQNLITAVMPILMEILNEVGPILAYIGEIVGNVLKNAFELITPIIDNVTQVFSGLIDFVTNIFKGNWSAAWQGIVDMFGGIFGGIVNIAKVPINAIIGVINGVIEAINDCGFSIPDWVPVLGGKKFSLDLPVIPKLATGGFTDGLSIAGEAGQEAVISFDPKYRSQNLSYWAQAGQMLGASDGELLSLLDGEIKSSQVMEYNMGDINFTPNIIIQGSADKQDIIEAIRETEPEFVDLLEELLGRARRHVYG